MFGFRNRMERRGRNRGLLKACAGTLAAALVWVALPANAAFTIDSTLGGNPLAGAMYVNFDDVALGAGATLAKVRDQSQTELGTIGLQFAPDAKVVQGSASGLYAAPFLSGTNGVFFGNAPVPGVDNTHYLTSGKDGSPNIGAAATLDFTVWGPQNYFGILWGSVDDYNTLSFYNGNTLVATITGDDVFNSPVGNQGLQGTVYVNIFATDGDAFTRVVATSSEYAFEFDNVAFKVVPEPGTLASAFLVVGVAGIGALRRRKRSSE